MKVTFTIISLFFLVVNITFSQNNQSSSLLASTFIGSNSYDDDYGPSMLIDNEGFVYLCGYTTSGTFPIVNGFDNTYNGGKDIFVAKFSNDLKTLVASTFIGGIGDELEATMAFDANKQYIYISGYTTSADFPVTINVFDSTHNGGSDVFVLKIDKNLQTVYSSTFIGGTANEGQQWPKLDIVVGNSGNVYIAGLTCSSDFPMISGQSYDSIYSGGTIGGDGFVAVFNSDLSELLGSTYLGGNKNEWRMSITLDKYENIFVSGETESSNFEFTSNAYNSLFNGASDIFICKYNQNLSQMLVSTSFGKTNYEEPLDIKLDKNENVFIVGYTKSSNFTTTTNVYDKTWNGGNRDSYIAKFDNNLQNLISSTFLGGIYRDDITTLQIDTIGNIYVAGNTSSYNFPFTQNPYDSIFNGGSEYGDAFISVFDNDLTQLKASTYFGGSNDDRILDISLFDKNVFVAGCSKSNDFPFTSLTYDSLNSGITGDCFISKFKSNLNGVILQNNLSKELINPDIKIFPNPFIDNFFIQFDLQKSDIFKVEIYNFQGKLCYFSENLNLFKGIQTLHFNVDYLQNGLYYCKISSKILSNSLKIVKTN